MTSEERVMPDDTNRRVAEACGFRIIGNDEDAVTIIDERCECCHQIADFLHYEEFAVLAAEKFGLFDWSERCCSMRRELHGQSQTWVVYRGTELISSGTFCEAICRAILTLHDRNPRR